ncbi:MAG: Cna B-type domain-containing protein [Bacilli bacterium]|nr:Cna B-type domain-containing protein [Bacilli bacterium]
MKKSKLKYFLMIIMLMLNVLPVMADDNVVDFTKKGTIAISLSDSIEGTEVKGAAITIYKVADAYSKDSNLAFDYHSSVDKYKQDIEAGNITSSVLDIIKNSDMVSKEGITDGNGKVQFSNLDLGLYLVVQTNEVNGYSVIDPFLVMIPQVQDNSWVYDVEATPKVDIIKLFDLTVIKVWNVSTDTEVPKEVVVELLKDGEVIDTVKLNDGNGWTYSWRQIEKSDKYSVREKDVPKGYTVSYRTEGNKFIVINTKGLVQTGRQMWIISLSALVGLLFIVIGFICDKRERNEQNR